MPDFALRHVPALAAKAPHRSSGIALSALPEGHVIHVLGSFDGPDLAPALAALAPGNAYAVRRAGPGQWFIVGDEPSMAEALLQRLPQGAYGVDQSHGRVGIRIEGPMVERVLCKGTALDLDLSVFPVGHSANTLIGHIGAHITRVAANAFEIIALRGFAESLWDDLLQMSAEFAE